ncbi:MULTISPECIES: NAD(P)H-dependent flavin oxidoreductase [Methylobacterium]|uniref:Propionate 3-nitronate monooxygenase n=1 Tax=Methylobacterium thuringiense TaxID=1003091 RepID=A0ABQ4TN76_9HYPH|nr:MULTISPECIES: nitronate monooxygenase [Methylobacterium]TXN19539.1 nitronate monooxygenase [Methylobacterium sp. WL9]GJE56121.1 Nitronate monooxygenase [Methylobacterium thuringiense]
MHWPDRRILDLAGIEHPIVLAPMVGAKAALTACVTGAGALGSLACAASTAEQVRAAVAAIRESADGPINLNFFCHALPADDAPRDAGWLARLGPYYREYGLDPAAATPMAKRAPFDAEMCAVVEALRPKVVSFHFGLPDAALLDRVRAAGCRVFASATTVAEARWLDARGVDAVIAQGAEAGGHRGMFLPGELAAQPGLFALLPQVADAVGVPVIAAGGIADGRGIAAAFALGAAAVQIGTAYLRCPEAGISEVHRAALRAARDTDTAITDVFTGRPARGLFNRAMRELGPLCEDAPAFPKAAVALQPLRAAAEARGQGDFSPLWAGQAAALARDLGAATLTRLLAGEATQRLAKIGGRYPP